MSQTSSFLIMNDAGAAVRARINEVIAALQSSNAGSTPPTDTRPGMLWCDTAGPDPVVMIRNATDTAWCDLLDGGTY